LNVFTFYTAVIILSMNLDSMCFIYWCFSASVCRANHGLRENMGRKKLVLLERQLLNREIDFSWYCSVLQFILHSVHMTLRICYTLHVLHSADDTLHILHSADDTLHILHSADDTLRITLCIYYIIGR